MSGLEPQTLQTLSDEFAIPGVLAFTEDEHGLLRARIATPACTAELYLHGAHLTAWRPAGHAPVLFLSERSSFAAGKAIRGGVPVIFPWFGARTATAESPRTDGPAHGFARTSVWRLTAALLLGEDLHLTLTLGPDDATRALGYDHFLLAGEFILGAELRIRLTVANPGPQPLTFEEALHTYFAVGDARQVRLLGLGETEFLDKTDGFQRKRQTEPALRLTGETDRPYLNTEATVTLEDPALQRRITVAKTGSHTTVVWNPWSELSAKLADMADDGWLRMVCIETANAAENRLTLAPGQVHTMETHIAVAAISA